jgi:hypothetical protein
VGGAHLRLIIHDQTGYHPSMDKGIDSDQGLLSPVELGQAMDDSTSSTDPPNSKTVPGSGQ